ncbi:hypothetical protein CR513_08699, partial [Mucuna pruriens]
MSHIEGSDLLKDDLKFEAWDDDQNYMFYSSIHELWENLIETYSMKKDFAACYDIESKISTLDNEPSH